jgi:hypothetical protein
MDDSFVHIDPDSDFSIDNLPYGCYTSAARGRAARRRLCVALGDSVVDLAELQRAGLFSGPVLSDHPECFQQVWECGTRIRGRSRRGAVWAESGERQWSVTQTHSCETRTRNQHAHARPNTRTHAHAITAHADRTPSMPLWPWGSPRGPRRGRRCGGCCLPRRGACATTPRCGRRPSSLWCASLIWTVCLLPVHHCIVKGQLYMSATNPSSPPSFIKSPKRTTSTSNPLV